MPQPLILVGTGGNALDVLDVVDSINSTAPTWIVRGFLDDAHPAGAKLWGYRVLGKVTDADKFVDSYFVLTIGSDRSCFRRPALVASMNLDAHRFPQLVHRTAGVSARAEVGRGTYICCCASVGGGARIGNHVHIGAGCLIGHEAILRDYAVIAAGAVISGRVKIGRASYIGANASIRGALNIGDGAIVGMGAVVVTDVASGDVVVGNPARPRSTKASEKLMGTSP